MSKRVPTLYFNFRSPYSWMAVRRLRELLPDADRRVVFRPYWDADDDTAKAVADRDAEILYVPMSKAKHLYILGDTKRIAARFGYPMKWPVDIGNPWWERPHLAWLRARRLGAGREFYDAVVAARWERAENVCDEEVLARLATSVGLDAGELLSAAQDEQIRAEGVDALVDAYHDDVFGAPYFKLGRQRFWGLDRVADFVAALEARDDPDPVAGAPTAVLTRVGGYDRDTAGGCG
ncbi:MULTISPECIES: 2-hydroxychromene-2-carboxylate isomerase [unclassified Saccharothrix]|uniref:2-hydroxychromene-2-carboxylate isomerase n=1 Tax=unclassified Saccharothrix TaxID=2593673 RepID=UPI00307FCBE1